MQKNALHKNAQGPTIPLPDLLDLQAVCKALTVPMGTLLRRLSDYNRAAPGKGWAPIKPDTTEGKHAKHLFKKHRLPEFRAMLDATISTRKRGRPRKSTN